MKKALIVIDIQNDYFCGGNMELVEIDDVLIKINKLIKFAKNEGYSIYIIQHIMQRKGATFFLPKTVGVELHEALDAKDTTLVTKHYPNSFRETNLQASLEKEGIKELIICGAMTHMCVDSTVRAGFDLGYDITLAEDACATRDLIFNGHVVGAKDVQRSFMSALGSVFCEVKAVDEVLDN